MTKDEIAREEQILPLPQYYQPFSIIIPLLTESVHSFTYMYMGKGSIQHLCMIHSVTKMFVQNLQELLNYVVAGKGTL